MKHVYLCSRVALDARPLNNEVAKSLRSAGFYVYVPHEVAPNNLSQEDIDNGRYDMAAIYAYDFNAMQAADACVVVGRTGRDCAFEIGYFAAKGIPVFFLPDTDETYKTCPMLLPTLTSYGLIGDVAKVGTFVKETLERGFYYEFKTN